MTTAVCTLADGSTIPCQVSGIASGAGGGLFLFAVFCSWWALQSGRNAVGWFLAGLFLAPFAGIALLYHTVLDRREAAR